MRRFSAFAATAACALAVLVVPSAGAADTATTYPVFASSGNVIFDFVNVGESATKKVAIANTGTGPLAISKSELTGPQAKDYAITADTCTGTSIAPNTGCEMTLRYTPSAAGTRVAFIKLTDNTPCHSWITVAGSATTPAPQAQAAACESNVQNVLSGLSAATPTNTVAGQSIISLPNSCVSRRKVTFHLAAPARTIFKKVTVKLGKRTIKTLKGKSITSTVDLTGLPRGRFTLTIGGLLNTGRTVTQTRHYVTCVASKS